MLQSHGSIYSVTADSNLPESVALPELPELDADDACEGWPNKASLEWTLTHATRK
jgi:hypothetical protein